MQNTIAHKMYNVRLLS